MTCCGKHRQEVDRVRTGDSLTKPTILGSEEVSLYHNSPCLVFYREKCFQDRWFWLKANPDAELTRGCW